MDIWLTSQVGALLEVLPNRLTADVLEQLRLSKQALVLKLHFRIISWTRFSSLILILSLFCVKVELGSRAGDLKQMLIDLLDDPHEIRRICIMGMNCTLDKLSDNMECSVPLEKQIAEGTDWVHRRDFVSFGDTRLHY